MQYGKKALRGAARLFLKVNVYKRLLEMYSSKETLEDAYASIDDFAASLGEDLKRDVKNEYRIQAFCREYNLY